MRSFSTGEKDSPFSDDPPGPPAPGFILLLFLVTMAAIQFTPLIVTLWLEPAGWIIVTVAVTATLIAVGVGALLANLLNLGIGVFQSMRREHVPILRFVLPILILVGGMWWLVAEIALNGSLLEAYSSLASGASRAVDVAKQHPVTLLPFIVVMIPAVVAIRGAIESLNE